MDSTCHLFAHLRAESLRYLLENLDLWEKETIGEQLLFCSRSSPAYKIILTPSIPQPQALPFFCYVTYREGAIKYDVKIVDVECNAVYKGSAYSVNDGTVLLPAPRGFYVPDGGQLIPLSCFLETDLEWKLFQLFRKHFPDPIAYCDLQEMILVFQTEERLVSFEQWFQRRLSTYHRLKSGYPGRTIHTTIPGLIDQVYGGMAAVEMFSGMRY